MKRHRTSLAPWSRLLRCQPHALMSGEEVLLVYEQRCPNGAKAATALPLTEKFKSDKSRIRSMKNAAFL